MSKFYNISNHSSNTWSEKQINAAKDFSLEIIDIPFPNVNPNYDNEKILSLCFEIMKKIEEYSVCMVQGEFSLTYMLTTMLIKLKGCVVVVACSERKSKEQIINGKTEKISEFEFIQFREIINYHF